MGCSQAQKKSNSKKNDGPGRKLDYTQKVSFLASDGDTLSSIKAAVADNDSKRNEGLMDVQDMPEANGMLFVFPDTKPRSFWMANTPLALDIIYVNADSSIVRIHHNAQPFSNKSLPSGEPAKYVIETNGGYTISHDIQEGMRVHF